MGEKGCCLFIHLFIYFHDFFFETSSDVLIPIYFSFAKQSTSFKAGPPLEAILVIFGRRALIFFLFESSWKKMKNDATFVRMRSGDHLGDAKMSKKGTSLRRI